MKVTLTNKYAPREGDTIDVTEAAGKRLIDKGWAEKAGSLSKTEEPKADAKPAKKAAKTAAKKRS